MKSGRLMHSFNNWMCYINTFANITLFGAGTARFDHADRSRPMSLKPMSTAPN